VVSERLRATPPYHGTMTARGSWVVLSRRRTALPMFARMSDTVAWAAVPVAVAHRMTRGPNPAVNRTRRLMSSTWRVFVRRAGYLTR